MFNRPILNIPRTKLEAVHNVSAIIVMLAVLSYLAAVWTSLPEQFPTHFDFSGKPNGWGGKGGLILLPILSALVYGGLTLLGKIPHKFNYLREITEENAQRQYVIALHMISWMKVLIVVLFSSIEWNMIRAAFGNEPAAWSMLSFVVVLLGTIAFYIRKSLRAA
ncbi:DUF1648 domain-containing protein [Paenibacillus sp. SI8]|uniref:DUF1648 domain-containing protein n=1 Tax=unclassified Paenibacillus TaxID=185978 RepID=UPI00346759B0